MEAKFNYARQAESQAAGSTAESLFRRRSPPAAVIKIIKQLYAQTNLLAVNYPAQGGITPGLRSWRGSSAPAARWRVLPAVPARAASHAQGEQGPWDPSGVGSSWRRAAQDLRALEGSRPGEEGLISRSEIKARSPPQAAPSNSAARGGRQSQFNGHKPSL
jgi:hypothetical protein